MSVMYRTLDVRLLNRPLTWPDYRLSYALLVTWMRCVRSVVELTHSLGAIRLHRRRLHGSGPSIALLRPISPKAPSLAS